MPKLPSFQALRESIPFWNAQKMSETLGGPRCYHLTGDQRLGLRREWRAHTYLKTSFQKWDFRMSTPDEDLNGIDIIATNPDGKVMTFQVGGGLVKEYSTDYYVQMTDYKIYLYKREKGTDKLSYI